MTISRNISVLAQGASTSGILAGGYGGLGASIAPTTAGNTIFTTDGSVWSSTQKIVRGTNVATTSGTSIDFTSVPSWVKRITIMLNGVSTSGTSLVIIQIGSTTFTTSGYLGVVNGAGNAVATSCQNVTTGFGTTTSATAVEARAGVINIVNITGNTWVASGTVGTTVGTYGGYASGNVTLGGVLDRVRLTTINGTDTFDAGSVNLLWE
jgi:hypothetical protein